MSCNFFYAILLFAFLILESCNSGRANSENVSKESESIKALRDSITALKQSLVNTSTTEHKEANPRNESLNRITKYVFCEINYSYYSYEYMPRRVHQSPARLISIDQNGEHHAPPEETIIEEHWGNKDLITKTVFCEVAEIKDYNEDEKYRFLDKIEARLRTTSNAVPRDFYGTPKYSKPKPSSEFKVISRKLHVFDSYAEASEALGLLK